MARSRLKALPDVGDGDDFGAARIDEQLRRQAKKADRERQEIFEQGRKEGRREARTRRRPSLPRELRSVTAPLKAPAREGMRIVVMVLGLTLLLLVLENASTVSRAVNGVRRAIEWLANPEAVIPYASEA